MSGPAGPTPAGIGEMLIMYRKQSAATLVVVVVLVLAAFAADETTRKEYHFKVAHQAREYVVTQYGPVSLKPGPSKHVVVTAILSSGKVEVDQNKSGNRVSVISHLLEGADA